jgi:hypothetical protein
MKSKLLSFLMLLTVAVNYGQITTSPAGIAIQGIARDNNNTASTSADLNMKFTIYGEGGTTIFEITKTVTTDTFGVFSTVLEPNAAQNVQIANAQAFLRITDQKTTTIISDEKLKQVPYAIAASNGVPTGSIMPYIGTTAPAGWVMCDGSLLEANATNKALRDLVGGSTPNLRGMFLRGAGENPDYAAEIEPNTLKAVQSSDNKSHNHNGNTLETNLQGRHNHGSSDNTNLLVQKNSFSTASGIDNSPTEINLVNTPQIPFDGEHKHTISGSTGNSGGSESRPINYGVNYIIKL